VELSTFDGSIEEEIDSKSDSFKCDGILKSESRSREGSVIKNHAICNGEETKNKVRLARETKIALKEIKGIGIFEFQLTSDPSALNFIASMNDNLEMEPTQKKGSEAVIQNPASS